MANKKDEGLLGEIIGEELGEWDKMFDSLHEAKDDIGNPEHFALPSEGLIEAEEPDLPVQRIAADDFDQDAPFAPSGSARQTIPHESYDVDSFVLGPSGGSTFPDSGSSVASAEPPPFLDSNAPVFSDRDDDFAELGFTDAAQSLGSLLGSGPIELPESEFDSSPATTAGIGASRSFSYSSPPGSEGAAFDDFSSELTSAISAGALPRVSESAAAFFEETEQSGPTELTLELDDDFYEGIQIETKEAPPTPVVSALAVAPASASASGGRGRAHTVRRESTAPILGIAEVTAVKANPMAAEEQFTEDTSVRAINVPAMARRADTDEPLDFDGLAPRDRQMQAPAQQAVPETITEDVVQKVAQAVPDAIDEENTTAASPSGFGVLRTGRERAGSEDNFELAREVDGALDEIFTASQAQESDAHAEEHITRDPAPALDGVVEAAVEDAVSLSTGTLHTSPRLREMDVEPELPLGKFEDLSPPLALGDIRVPERVEPAIDDRTEELVSTLMLYERELELVDEVAPSIRLRIEASRLAETLGDLDKARSHLDEALKLDPRLVPANRALRRIERLLGNWSEVLNQLDKEMAKASPLEVRALASYRVDLLIATGEFDLARVAVGELLDSAPADTRSLLANLELAFVDGRLDELAATIEALAAALTELEFRAAILALQGVVATQLANHELASKSFSKSSGLVPNLGANLAQLAALASLERPEESTEIMAQTSASHPGSLGTALAYCATENWLRSLQYMQARELLDTASRSAPESVLLAQAKVRAGGDSRAEMAQRLEDLAHLTKDPAVAAQCLTRASFFADPARAGDLLQEALRASPLDPVPRRALRRVYVRSGKGSELQALDGLAAAQDPDSRLVAFRSAVSSLDAGEFETTRNTLAPLIASDSRRIPETLLALELCYAENDQRQVQRLYEQLVSQGASRGSTEDARRGACRAQTRAAMQTRQPQLLISASESWRSWLEDSGRAAWTSAGYLGLTLAALAKNQEQVEACTVLALAQTQDGARTTQLTLERALPALVDSPARAADAFSELPADRIEARGAELCSYAHLASGDVPQASQVLYAQSLRDQEKSVLAADRRMYRSIYLQAQASDDSANLPFDMSVLDSLRSRHPAFAAAVELLAGQDHTSASPAAPDLELAKPAFDHDDLSAEIRRAEAVAASGDIESAAELFSSLALVHPDDTLIAYNYQRFAWQAGASALLAETSLVAMRQAEDRNDRAGKAIACAALARIDGELRGDADSALMLWESASKAAPDNAMFQRILEREYGERGSSHTRSEALRVVLGRIITDVADGRERSAYLCERARLGVILGRDESEAKADFRAAFQEDAQCREALLYLESHASVGGPSEDLAELEAMTANYFAEDQRARAAFLVRAGETWRSLKDREKALAHFKAAAEHMPGFAPALFAWRDLALDHELWQELAEACLLEASSVDSDAARIDLYLLAGVTLMDKTEERQAAAEALRNVLVVDPRHREAFVRLRTLYMQEERHDDLAQILAMRLEVEKDELAECEIHHALATLYREFLDNPGEALEHYRAILAHRPNDKEAVVGVCEIAWQKGMWAEAAEAMMVRARLENDQSVLKELFSRLGTIYSHHLPEPTWALKSFHKVVSIDPTDKHALSELAALGLQTGDYKLALGACEQLIKQDPPVNEKISHLHRIAEIFIKGFDNPQRAERALRVALDLDQTSDAAFDALIGFYLGRNDLRSARVHIDSVVAAMQAILVTRPTEAVAYRVIARAMQARVQAGVPESKVVASAAAGMALLLGADDEATRELASMTSPACAELAKSEHDDMLFPSEAPSSLRALLDLLGDRLAKHAGIDVRNHGVGRGDRLRKGSAPVATAILEQAAEMGIEDVDIYISKQKTRISTSEPTNPPALILGSELGTLDRPTELRFLVGRSLKFISAQLSVPLQLGEAGFGVLLVGILRQFQPEFAPIGVDTEAAKSEQQKLRRLIPSNMLQELAPYALGLASPGFDHRVIYGGLRDAGNRAGLLCAGEVTASIRALMRIKQIDSLALAMQDSEIRSLVSFACSEQYAALWAALKS